MDQPFIIGTVDTALGKIPRVASVLKWADRLGTIKARWGINRLDYKVDPGLYALGDSGPQSPVFVTANYKMSFDCLREALGNLDAWILVLDTKGINVWCAAGKGTFGTEELVRRVQATGLEKVAAHRDLILPRAWGSRDCRPCRQKAFKIQGDLRADSGGGYSGLSGRRDAGHAGNAPQEFWFSGKNRFDPD